MTFAEQKQQALGLIYSLALHAVLAFLLVFSIAPTMTKPLMGNTIQAQIVDLSTLKKLQQNRQKKPAKQKTPKPKPKPVSKPEPKPKPKPKPEPKPKPKPKPKLQPKPKPKPKPENAERLKKIEALRKQRQQLEQQAVKPNEPTVEEPTATEPPSQSQLGQTTAKPSAEDSLRAEYLAGIQAAVTRQWARPISTKAGLKCLIKVNQIPGGGVIDVAVGSPCNASAVVKNSIVNAVKKADPLPYQGFEQVFDRKLNFIFQYQGD